MTSRVAVFGATRADLFPLAPVLRALAAAPDLDVILLASGTIGNPEFGDPLADLDLTGVTVEPVAGGLSASDYRAQTDGGARIAEAVGAALDRLRPAACVVLGDRWELLYAVPAMVLLGVPLVHLHGGEVTEGAVDDRVRHAVSKLADLHCVSTERAAARLRQLGEPADRVVVTGAPALDQVAAVAAADDTRLAAILGRPLVRPLALVTYHPVTAGGPDPGPGAADVLAAVAATAGSAIVTHPGLDRGREAVLGAISAATAAWPQLVEVSSLGADYLPVLAAADVVVGNSSSGIFEAATFGVPVVNVGDRQRGRVSGANVLDAADDRAAVEAAIRTALEAAFRERARAAVNVYGDGHAAPRIVDVVRRAVGGGLARKPFVDLECADLDDRAVRAGSPS
jgi:UDP-N-acetylglucosamine 2-epimerase (non-hydrolysing)